MYLDGWKIYGIQKYNWPRMNGFTMNTKIHKYNLPHEWIPPPGRFSASHSASISGWVGVTAFERCICQNDNYLGWKWGFLMIMIVFKCERDGKICKCWDVCIYSCDGDWISNFTFQMFTLERGKRRKIITAWKRCHTCNIIQIAAIPIQKLPYL